MLNLQRIILTFWVGGIWATGYLVVPTLFRELQDPALAGQLAGKLFILMSWTGLVCAVLLLVIFYLLDAAKWRYLVIFAMCAMILVSLFYLTPEIAQLKVLSEGAIQQSEGLYNTFAILHGLASGLFLLVSLLGLLLVTGEPGAKS